MPAPSQITTGQNNKEVVINENFIAASWGCSFGANFETTSGLTFGIYGGVLNVDGTQVIVANDTLSMAASTTNFVSISRAGVFAVNSTAFLVGNIPLWEVVTDSSGITSRGDRRRFMTRPLGARLSKAITTADVTLVAAEIFAEHIVTTGALTNNRALIVPAVVNEYTVQNTCTGAFTMTVRTPSGSGIVVPQGRRVRLLCDGTNVVLAENYQPFQDIAYAAAITPDIGAGRTIHVGVLTGNITINAPTGVIKGERVAFTFIQDGTGGRTITWNAVFKKAADGAGTANQVGTIEFICYDGTNFIQSGGALTFFT